MIISDKQIMALINIAYHQIDLLLKSPNENTQNNLNQISSLITEILDQQSTELKTI